MGPDRLAMLRYGVDDLRAVLRERPALPAAVRVERCKFSEAWLRTLVDPPIDTAALCDKLTMAGFEVEDVAPAAPPFANVVVGEIVSVAPHPDADRLRVCTVDVGTR